MVAPANPISRMSPSIQKLENRLSMSPSIQKLENRLSGLSYIFLPALRQHY
jgi:hypothetical protein